MNADYSAWKHGVIGLTKALAIELGLRGMTNMTANASGKTFQMYLLHALRLSHPESRPFLPDAASGATASRRISSCPGHAFCTRCNLSSQLGLACGFRLDRLD